MKKLLIAIFSSVFIQNLFTYIRGICLHARIRYYNKYLHGRLRFVSQGDGGVVIQGDIKKFTIHYTSHLKSNTFIDASGGVEIGGYFHPGRGLTIFSTNHNYFAPGKIPYDEKVIPGKVVIKDCVWCGTNVTIVPGVTIEEGAVITAGAVVTKDVPPCAVVGGNPARVIKYRDKDRYEELKEKKLFF